MKFRLLGILLLCIISPTNAMLPGFLDFLDGILGKILNFLCPLFRLSCGTNVITPTPTTETTPSVTPAGLRSPVPSASPNAAPAPANEGTMRLTSIDDLTYSGAFRLADGGDDFGVNYAVGALAFCPTRNSLFIAGHVQQNSIGEYPVVSSPGMQSEVSELPVTDDPLQAFTPVLDLAGAAHQYERITGILCLEPSLLINKEIWYDASGENTETTAIVPDLANLASVANGFFELDGSAHSAGYMGMIPEELQEDFGAQYFTGWSSVWSIISRYSLGPSLWTFNPNDTSSPNKPPARLQATAFMSYDYNTQHLSGGATYWAEQGTPGPFAPADPLWNPLSRAVYAFFVPGTRTFVAIGSIAGLATGIGYKAIQEDGNECGGPCPFGVEDHDNYYWFYDVDDILAAENVYDPKPYAFGVFQVPFDDNGKNRIIGGTVDQRNNVLYVAVENAGRVGDYDLAPLIVTYSLPDPS